MALPKAFLAKIAWKGSFVGMNPFMCPAICFPREFLLTIRVFTNENLRICFFGRLLKKVGKRRGECKLSKIDYMRTNFLSYARWAISTYIIIYRNDTGIE